MRCAELSRCEIISEFHASDRIRIIVVSTLHYFIVRFRRDHVLAGVRSKSSNFEGEMYFIDESFLITSTSCSPAFVSEMVDVSAACWVDAWLVQAL